VEAITPFDPHKGKSLKVRMPLLVSLDPELLRSIEVCLQRTLGQLQVDWAQQHPPQIQRFDDKEYLFTYFHPMGLKELAFGY
jgi:hypothetical protein